MRRSRLNRILNPRVKVKPACDVTWAEARQFFVELRTWGEWKGYKPGWAAVNYKERLGVWPLWQWNTQLLPQNVSCETMAYLDQRKKEWAKQRKAERKAAIARQAEMGEMGEGIGVRAAIGATNGDDWIDLADYRP